MKILIYSLLGVAICLIIYNFTFLDFQDILNGDSATALIGILASSIVVVLMVILLMSRAISEKANK